MSKIRSLTELEGYGGALCHGCFDILHIGHVRQFQYAATLADILIVTITADRFIRKGPGRPVFPAEIRAEMIAAIGCVTYVAIVEESTGLSAIEAIRPAYYVKGNEYAGMGGISEMERLLVELHCGRTVYTERYCSSTSLMERLHV